MKRVQMLGLCRFSYLGLRGFQVIHEDIEERRRFLYDPGRLERRWFWFENVTLPGLRAQTDPDFTVVVMTGPDLPDPWMAKLRECCAEIPQLKLSIVEPMRYHLPACWRAVAPYIDGSADVIGHFRQDDDDAVAVDFIKQAKRDFGCTRPVWRRNGRASLDYMRGLVLKASESGVAVESRMIHNACAGLTIFLRPEEEATAVHFPHWRIAEHMPGVTFGEKVMFCRVMNHDNDSADVGPGYELGAQPGSAKKTLEARFGIDFARIDRAAQHFGKPLATRPHRSKD